ncbi:MULTISPECIES: DUF3885 domain-containing protein [Bacillus]|uniref:DUF3885 domain-containing protein n=1 Tax=Bacillus TaxID=1386 RepID=UPI000938405A|nr:MULTISPECIES: hypothetical protein [Bacillus]APP15818.1 hypothetical protein BS467_08800 [Bacillus altitudinis]MBG9902034.1 hypothetical protein [Bacillus altitudinis]MBL7244114.1 hypothetical protein [Bacillus altitudinis]MDJ0286778.1 hypothetical protein [Bacillus altitudinis]
MVHLDYIQSEFNIDLINDSFDELPLSLHIQLEKEMYQFNDQGNLNPQYFNKVYNVAISIFDELFGENDLLFVVTIVRSEHSLQRPIGVYSKYSKKINKYRLNVKNYKDENGKVIQYSLETKKQHIEYKKIIKAICNQDFKSMAPRFNDKYSSYPEIFFINKDFIYHIYDDRGAFLLFKDERKYEKFKTKYSTLMVGEDYN